MNALKLFAFFLLCAGFVFSITEFGPGTALDCNSGSKDISVSDYYIWNTTGGAQMDYAGANNRFCLNITVSDVTIDCDRTGTKGIINGGAAPAAAIYIGPGIQNVTIINCQIQNFNRSGNLNGGIRIQQASDILIQSNYFENDRNGVWANDSSDVEILENDFQNVRFGVYVDGLAGSDSFLISDNTMDTINQSGIHVELLSDSLISENAISNTGIRGLLVDRGSSVGLVANEVSFSCLASGGAGIRVMNSSDISVEGNEVHDCTCSNTGIYVTDTPAPTLSYNNVHDNEGNGIYLLRADGATLIENNASWNTKNGISLSNSSFSSVTGSISHDNTENGLYAMNCQNLTVQSGIYYQNGENGIDAGGVYGTGARLAGNIFSHDNSIDGVILRSGATGSLVTGGMIYSNGGIGIHLLGPDNCVVWMNDVSNNTLQGIYINNSANPNVSWNWAYENGAQGVYIRSSAGATVQENTVFANDMEGFYIYNSDNGAYSFNTLESNAQGGYYIYSSTGCTLSNETIYWNAESGGNAISAVTGSDGLSILDSQIFENENGVSIDNSDNFVMSGCTIYDNFLSSLHIINSLNAQVSDTEQYWNGAGYEFEDSTGDISDSSAYNLYAGIKGLEVTGTSAVTSDSLMIHSAADSYFAVVSTSTFDATNFWLGLDTLYGINYTNLNLAGTGVYAQDGNVLIAQDFISMDSGDANLAGLLGVPATLTTNTNSCNGLRYFNNSVDAFPQSANEVLMNGAQFTPVASSCDAGVVAYSVDGLSGYTVVSYASSSGDGGSDKGTLQLDVSSNPLAGEKVTLTVESKGDPVSGAEVVVRVPYGAAYKYYYPGTTNSNGEVSFTPDFEGNYKATADKSGYLDGELFFSVGPAEAPECSIDSDCASGKVCSGGECEKAPAAEILPPECTADSGCASGEICSSGTCVASQASPAEEVDEAKLDAQHAIAQAQQEIGNAKYAGKGVSEAERLLQLAQSALESGNYEEAIRLANEARLAAQNAAFPIREVSSPDTTGQPAVPQAAPKAEPGFPWPLLLLLLVILGGGAALLYWYFGGREKKK